MAGGISLRSAFDWRTGRTIMLVLLVLAASFYAGTLFGNQAPIYVSQLTSGNKNYNNNNSSSSLGAGSSTFSPNRNSGNGHTNESRSSGMLLFQRSSQLVYTHC